MICKVRIFPKNVPLDNSYANAVNFSNITKDEFFSKYDPNYSGINAAAPIVFPFNNGINTSLTLSIDMIDNMSVTDALNANYLHLRTYDDTGGSIIKDYFYFILSSKVLTRNTISFELELDVMSTYQDALDSNKKVFVERIHQDRFNKISNTSEYLQFSDLNFNNDELASKFNAKIVKEIISNHLLPIHQDESINSKLNSIWCYIWLSERWSGIDDEGDYAFSYTNNNDNFETPYYCVYAPINYNVGTNVKDDLGLYNATSFKKWFTAIAKSSICVSIIFSYAPPFLNLSNEECYIIDRSLDPQSLELNGEIIVFEDITRNNKLVSKTLWEGRNIGEYITCLGMQYLLSFEGNYQYSNVLTQNTYLKPTTPYEKTISLVNEPCLNSLPFKKITLVTPNGSKQDYDYLKLSYGNSFINIKLNEAISPTGTKSICSIQNDSVLYNYYQDFQNTKDGLISASSYSLPPINDKLVDYLENNKNYKTSLYANSLLNLSQGAVKSIITGNPLGAVGSIFSVVGNFVNSELNIDRLSDCPKTMGAIGSDIGFDFITSFKKPFIIIYDLDDFSKQQVYDFYFKFGKIYNKMDYLDFNTLFKRCNFTYIKTNEETFRDKIKSTSLLNDGIVEKIKNIFNKGITFWNVEYEFDGDIYTFDIGDYSKENWERRIFE